MGFKKYPRLYGFEKHLLLKTYEDEKVKNLFEALDLGAGDAPLRLILRLRAFGIRL